ncbi:hypothetical protein BGX27_000028 [Mortierella sp. AM989]|nr:hypothetical protein BGX27_000028 [Mortierella sp. AM989]
MGRLIERDLDGEMMAKIKVLFGEALESVKKDYPTIPSFGFEQIVDSLDENDHLTKDIFNFLVYEAAQRHRAAHPNEAFPRPATIHHYLPQNSIPSVSSPSSSPSNSLSTSLSSLAFSSRLLRNQQLVRSLLSEGDETELGSALENTSLWQLNSVQNVSVRESNGMSSSVAIAAPTSPNSAHGSAFRLGRRTLTRSSDQGLDDDSDGEEEDDYIISQTRRELRDLDVAFPARVATQAEMRSRQAAAECHPELAVLSGVLALLGVMAFLHLYHCLEMAQ